MFSQSQSSIYFYFSSGMAPAAAGDAPHALRKNDGPEWLWMPTSENKAQCSLPCRPMSPTTKRCKDLRGRLRSLSRTPGKGTSGHRLRHVSRGAAAVQGQRCDRRSATRKLLESRQWNSPDGHAESFCKPQLTDNQMWQVAQLVAHANEIPDSVKQVLVPPTTPITPPGDATVKPVSPRKK